MFLGLWEVIGAPGGIVFYKNCTNVVYKTADNNRAHATTTIGCREKTGDCDGY